MSSLASLPALVALLALGACNSRDLHQIRIADVFQQRRVNAVDLLIVIDNSCSMVEEQDNLARNFDALIGTFTDAEVNWRIGVTTTDVDGERYRGQLMGGDDEIVLRGAGGSEISRVAYTREWGIQRGASLQLDPRYHGRSERADRKNWCISEASFGQGGKGTPGAWNPTCDGAPFSPPAGGTDDGPRGPRPDELVVTEIMAESPGLDSDCEWFEITNLTSSTLDLSGMRFEDEGQNRVVVPSGVTVGPYRPFVVGRNADRDANCRTPVDLAFPTGFVLNDDLRYIDAETPDVAELFAENVAQGTRGTGIEMGLEAVRQLFEPRYLEANADFLREEASFAVLVVSDEDDLSPYPVDAYLRYFTNLKGTPGWRTPGLVRVSGVIGKDPPPSASIPYSCTSPAGEAFYGRRYIEAANETHGLVESICEEDFAPIVERLGLTLSGLDAIFELSEWPVLESLEVRLFSGPNEDDFVRDLVRDVDYTYVGDGNYLYFEEEQVPPSEWFVVASYVVSPVVTELPPKEEP